MHELRDKRLDARGETDGTVDDALHDEATRSATAYSTLSTQKRRTRPTSVSKFWLSVESRREWSEPDGLSGSVGNVVKYWPTVKPSGEGKPVPCAVLTRVSSGDREKCEFEVDGV